MKTAEDLLYCGSIASNKTSDGNWADTSQDLHASLNAYVKRKQTLRIRVGITIFYTLSHTALNPNTNPNLPKHFIQSRELLQTHISHLRQFSFKKHKYNALWN